MRAHVRWRRRVAAAVLLALGGSTLVGSMGATAATDEVGAFSATQSVKRETFDSAGTATTVDERNLTVTVDHTRNLQGRERVQVSWSGAHPSGGRATNPFGENGLAQEYPMVVMQCRGRDDDSLPKAQQLSPETCWTSTRQQRSQQVASRQAVWRLDARADAADRGPLSGVESLPQGCEPAGDLFSVRLTPFVAKSGKVYPACSSDTMPPEAAVDGSFPAAEQAAFTSVDGSGTTGFEVRSSIENESLGCDQSTACSIVVVPIMGISCLRGTGDLNAINSSCRAKGQFEPGSSNFAGLGVDDTVSPLYWWSESNWQNRVTVPITFGAAPNVCNVLDTRPAVGFYGSELMSQATLQWAPAYCLRKDRFKFQHNVQPDQASFTLMEQKQAPGAFVSGKQTGDGSTPVGYAPTAVSGFAVSYVADKPDNAGEVVDLRLNARLVAKLLTESYTGSALGAGHPGMGKNPKSVNQDPEFRALNPALDDRAREAAAVVMTLSESSDVIKAATEYIASDPEASSFVAGTPDPWGMAVNPSYKDLELPVSEWPLKDDYKPDVSDPCLLANNDTPYLSRLAAPVTSFRKIAESVLDAWPLAQTRCSGLGTELSPFVLGRSERQGVGSRLLIGFTTLGDAERFGLRTASLQTTKVSSKATFSSAAGRTFVAPTRPAMAAAVGTAKQTARGEAFTLDVDRVRGAKGAYPGTLIVYTAARTGGLTKATAATVSSFIRVATTEGQQVGSGNGRLPDGYLPIVNRGATAALYRSAQQVASDVAGQVGDRTPTSAAPIGGGGAAVDVPVVEAPEATAAGPAEQVTNDSVQSLGRTESLTSSLAGWIFPLLLLMGLVGGFAGPVMRVLAARKALR